MNQLCCRHDLNVLDVIVPLAVGATAIVAAPVVLALVGFSSTGIVGGSIAAKMISMAAVANGGGVAAGGKYRSLLVSALD